MKATLIMFCCFIYLAAFTQPKATLHATSKYVFQSFVDCNMAEAWVGDTFRIFPGKYGEDPLWGNSANLKYANGKNADETFATKQDDFRQPIMPLNAKPGDDGLHGAVWFESIYQDKKDTSGRTLYAVYHNENYPATLPYNSVTKQGYINNNWPQGLTGYSTPAAVCRIGIMKSADGGLSWENKGIFIEDLQPNMILKPFNTSVTFAGGTGDPSAVASGDYLYLFYGEYGYAGAFSQSDYNTQTEYNGQCISIARIALHDLDDAAGKAKRWNGESFSGDYNKPGKPVKSLQIAVADGGGPTSKPTSKYYWGPSVSWNTYLQCWVMLMAKSEAASWQGNSIWISYNMNKDLGEANNAQQWSTPQLLLKKEGHVLWYPALQPLSREEDVINKLNSTKLGKEARLFYKDGTGKAPEEYVSEYMILFEK